MFKKFFITSMVVAVLMVGVVTANAAGRSQMADLALQQITGAERAMIVAGALLMHQANSIPAKTFDGRDLSNTVPQIDPDDPQPELVAFWQGVDYIQKSIALYNERDFVKAIDLARISQNFFMFAVKLATD